MWGKIRSIPLRSKRATLRRNRQGISVFWRSTIWISEPVWSSIPATGCGHWMKMHGIILPAFWVCKKRQEDGRMLIRMPALPLLSVWSRMPPPRRRPPVWGDGMKKTPPERCESVRSVSGCYSRLYFFRGCISPWIASAPNGTALYSLSEHSW